MTIVFTTILGGSDSLKPAPAGADRCVCFVDAVSSYSDAKGWELRETAIDGDPRRQAWQMRCVPHRLFDDYDRVVWVDASFTLTNLPRLLRDAGDAPVAALRHHARTSAYVEAQTLVRIGQARPQDIRVQADAYQRQGFISTHLSISCILVRDHSQTAQHFNETWATEIDTHRGDNTQLSLDYSAWKHGTEIRALKGTRHDNPYSTHDHADHKRRRKPYWMPA